MTRLSKIAALKNAPISKGIDPHKCTDADLDRLVSITDNQAKGIPWGVSDYVFLNALKEKQKLGPSIGQFNDTQKS